MGYVSFMEQYRRIPSQRVRTPAVHARLLVVILTVNSSFDGKVKVWSIDTRACVATHSETEKSIWSVRWLPKVGRSEGFATAGASRSISFYREATGG